MEKANYPSWRRSLDIYQAWNGKNVSINEVAKNFKVDRKTAKNAIDLIGDLLYPDSVGVAWPFEDLEVAFALVSRHASDKDVVKIVRIIRDNFRRLLDFFSYDRNWGDLPNVGPKYTDILQKVQDDSFVKNLHVRISYRTYLKLRKYAEARDKTVSWAVCMAVENLEEV